MTLGEFITKHKDLAPETPLTLLLGDGNKEYCIDSWVDMDEEEVN